MAEQQPMYRAYTIVEREKDVPFWLNIGVAFVHKDSKGFNVIQIGRASCRERV